jgi:hypothetical protein
MSDFISVKNTRIHLDAKDESLCLSFQYYKKYNFFNAGFHQGLDASARCPSIPFDVPRLSEEEVTKMVWLEIELTSTAGMVQQVPFIIKIPRELTLCD